MGVMQILQLQRGKSTFDAGSLDSPERKNDAKVLCVCEGVEKLTENKPPW